ncbi:MAG: amidase family protein [Actinomycetota bacterium]|nr:amidase family protein [Actinomycetota bacterium]
MVPRIDASELPELARGWGFDPSPDEAVELMAVAEAIFSTLDLLDGQEPDLPAPVEAVREPGSRPSAEEDPLNAIVRRCRVRAQRCEGLLSGKRLAMKDSVAIAGIPLTCGSAILQGFVPRYDATVTDRILRAGAEIVCITNMDDLAMSGGGESSWYGPTRNPFDPERSAGGSSSGSAAALWYDGIDLAVGCDQGGSIRAPASWCGVVGLKPTHSLVPYTGIAGIDQTFDHCGPMARTAESAALLLQVMAGKDPGDPRQREVPDSDYLGAIERAPEDLRGLRIGVVSEGFSADVGAEPATCEAVRSTVERLAGLGAEVRDVSLPEHLQAGGVAFAGFIEGMTALMSYGGNGIGWSGRYWEELAPAIVGGLRERADELSPQVKATLTAGRHLRDRLGGAPYARAQNLRPWLRAAYDRALAGADALLFPTTPFRAFRLDDELRTSERVLRGWANLANTYPTDMSGHPAISLPLAEADGLPVGVMLVGRRFDDARLLAIAATCERALGWAPAKGA